MATITADLWGTDDPQLVQVTVDGVPAGARLTITRESQGLPTERVRGAWDAIPNGAWIVLDGSAPPGRSIVYVATISETSGAITEISAAPIEVPDTAADRLYRRHWLSDPLTGRSVALDVISTPDERASEARAGVLWVHRRKTPIVNTDVPTSDSGVLTVTTDDPAQRAALVALLDLGRPLISRHTHDACDIPAVEVLAITRRSHQRWGRYGRRIWELAFVVTDEPDPNVPIPGKTLADLAAFVPTTLDDLALTFPTLLAIAQSELT